jgi:hypothetical protein
VDWLILLPHRSLDTKLNVTSHGFRISKDPAKLRELSAMLTEMATILEKEKD